MAEAHHFKEENNHLIFLDNLTVLITKENETWMAQGIEINYFAYGDSIEDVQDAFEVGLFETIKAHLNTNGNIIPMLEWAPSNILNKYYEKAREFSFTMLGAHEVKEAHMPMRNIRFLQAA